MQTNNTFEIRYLFLYEKEAYPMVGESPIYDDSVLPFDGWKMAKRSQVEFEVLPGRRVRLAGKILQGVTLPKTKSSQISMMKNLLAMYGPCLKVQKGGNYLNVDCFNKKENDFMKRLTETLSNLKFKYIV